MTNPYPVDPLHVPEVVTPPNLGDSPSYFTDRPRYLRTTLLVLAAIALVVVWWWATR